MYTHFHESLSDWLALNYKNIFYPGCHPTVWYNQHVYCRKDTQICFVCPRRANESECNSNYRKCHNRKQTQSKNTVWGRKKIICKIKKFATKTILDTFELVFQNFLYWNWYLCLQVEELMRISGKWMFTGRLILGGIFLARSVGANKKEVKHETYQKALNVLKSKTVAEIFNLTDPGAEAIR